MENEKMEIIGYSERGILSSLLYEINYTKNSIDLLDSFFKMILFPLRGKPRVSITDAKVLVEHSLSEFGDTDAILLLDTDQGKKTVFIEAKVKTSQSNEWTVENQFEKFKKEKKKGKVNSSNLISQLYHKTKLMYALKQHDIPKLITGIKFPKWSSRQIRKIGKNPVVLNAVGMLEEYKDEVFYIGIVPDTAENINEFFKSNEAALGNIFNNFTGLNLPNWGAVAWHEIYEFCKIINLKETLKVFKHNENQIY